MRSLIGLTLLLIIALPASAAPPAKIANASVVKPAVRGPAAVVVVPRFPEAGNPYNQRFVFVGSGKATDFATLDFVVNTVISRRSVRVPLHPTPDRKVAMIDFGELSSTFDDLHNMRNTFELMAVDEPWFLGLTVLNPDGKSITRLPNPHPSIGPLVARLQRQCLTQVPIIEMSWLLNRKLLATVDGGLYYKFARVPDDLNAFLLQEAGVTEQQALGRKIVSKAVMKRSKVTEKPRAVLLFHSLGGRTAINQGLVALTADTGDGNRNPDFSPVYNAFESKRDATEVIIERANGTHVFALFDGKGKRADSVPDNIAADTEIPGQFTKRLQPAIGCLRCHLEDGYRPVEHELLSFNTGPLQDQLALVKDRDAFEALLSEKLDKPLQRARDDYSDAAVSITKDYGIDVDARGLSANVATIARDYLYSPIGEQEAIAQLAMITRSRLPRGARINDLLGNRLRGDGFRESLFPSRDKDTGKPIVSMMNRTEFENILPDLIQDLRPDLMRPETDPVEPEELEPVERSVLVPAKP